MIWTLIKKDFLLKVKNPVGFLIMVSLPLLFAVLIGAVFGPKSSENISIKVKLLIEDHDNSFASQFISRAFSGGELAEMFDVTPVDSGQGKPLMDKGKGSALIVIPKGFGDNLFHEKTTELYLIKNPSESFAPKIVEETVDVLAEGTDRLIRIAAEPIRMIRARIDSESDLTSADVALISVNIYLLVKRVEDYLFPPIIQIHEQRTDQSDREDPLQRAKMYIHVLAGISIFSILFFISSMTREFYTESESHTLHRLLTGPISLSKFLIAKLLFLWITAFMAFMSVWIAAALFFGIQIPMHQILPFTAFAVVIIGSLTGISGCVYSITKKRAHAESAFPAIIIFFGMVGGAMMPPEALPEFIKPLSLLSPVYWGSDAIKKMLLADQPITSITLHFIVLAAILVVTNGLSLAFFNRKFKL